MKKKLIAIVTSLAMVATMVPATAFAATATPASASKSAAQTKNTTLFEVYMAELTSSAITKANAEEKLTVYTSAVNAYNTNVTAEEAATANIKALYAQLETAKTDLVNAFAGKMIDDIAAVAQKGKVTPGETFAKIESDQTALTTSLQQSINTVRSIVTNYNDYTEAKKAKNLATVISGQETNLKSSALSAVESAITAVETNAAFTAITSQATKEMASNYTTYANAKKNVSNATEDKKLIETYTTQFTAQTSTLTAAPTKSTVQTAEVLLERADADKKLTSALANALVSTEAGDYNTAKGNLVTAIDTAIGKVMDNDTAKEYTNRVAKLPTTLTLANAGDIQAIFAMVAANPDATVEDGDNETSATWYTGVAPATKTAAFAAIGDATSGSETGFQALIADKIDAYTNGNATVKAAIQKEVTDALVKAFPVPANPTLEDEESITNAKKVLGDGVLIGTDISDLLAVDAATTAAINAADAKITELNAKESAAATAFAKNVLETLPAKKSAANYGTLLNEAKAQYDALSDAYKKYGEKYSTGTMYTDGNSVTYTMANAYDKDKDASDATKAKSLMSLIAEYEKKQEDAPQDAIITQLVAGVDKLPAVDKLILENQDAVYALRDLREQLNAGKLDEFEDLTNTAGVKYNDTLDKAIEAIDKLYVADLVKQIGDLSIVAKDASLEAITAAKEANKAPREAYDKLNASQKAQVTNYARLQDAEAAVYAAEMYYATTQMAAVLEGVDVENMTAEQAKAILAVEDYIQSLTAAQRVEVEKDPNYAAFQAAAKVAREINGETPSEPSGPADLISVSKIATQVYTGKAITPNPVVKADGKTLVKDTDYTVTYANNTNLGEATVTITGMGAYKGTITTDFIIKPAKEKLTSVKAGKKQITLSYTAQKANGKTGYRIVYSAAKGQARAVNSTATKKTIKGLKSGKTYKVKVRAYKTINGTQYTGAYSTVKKVKVK